ncbi:MAG: hypothetical protein WCA49_02985 [Candidatus Sulfotelmatobacter sp.]
MGGDNYQWEKTPLMPLYEKHLKKGRSQQMAVKQAGIDGGWLLKKVIDDDKRRFNSRIRHLNREYLWVR